MALAWLGGRWALAACVFIGIPMSIYEGNVDLLVAASVVLGLRWPSALSFAILAKPTTALVLVWFLLRRDSRALLIALGTMALIVGLTFPLARDSWLRFFAMLADNSGSPEASWLGARLLIGLALTVLAVRTDRPWLMGIVAAIAQPTLTLRSLAVGISAIAIARRSRTSDAAPQGTGPSPHQLMPPGNPMIPTSYSVTESVSSTPASGRDEAGDRTTGKPTWTSRRRRSSISSGMVPLFGGLHRRFTNHLDHKPSMSRRD